MGAQAKFRAELLKRAGGRCEWVEDGQRCLHAAGLRATHRIPLRDMEPGDPRAYDPANGLLLCRWHDKETDPYAR